MIDIKEKVHRENILEKVYSYKTKKYRLIAIIPVIKEEKSLVYMFENNLQIKGFYVNFKKEDILPSVTDIFPSAYFTEEKASKNGDIRFKKNKYHLPSGFGISELPVGPQHPLLFEPVRFDVRMQDEKVLGLHPYMGYMCRDIEKKLKGMSWASALPLIERISINTSSAYLSAFCHAVESIQEIKVPQRAQFMRIIALELNRISAHLITLMRMAACLLNQNLYTMLGRIRQQFEESLSILCTKGDRFLPIAVGGMKEDISREKLLKALVILQEMACSLEGVSAFIQTSYSMKRRLENLAVIPWDFALINSTGTISKAVGLKRDSRMISFLPYKDIDFKPVIELEGDCMARINVIIKEIFQSVQLIDRAIETMPKGEIYSKSNVKKGGEKYVFLEEPGGEALLYLRLEQGGKIEDIKILTSGLINLTSALKLIEGQEFSDFFLILHSMGIDFAAVDM